jgi:hypothetical protein
MWVKLCERIGSHPKLLCVGAEAAWLWVTSIAYANAHVTDGVLPKKALRAFFPTDDWTPTKLRGLADRLVEAGLWEETGGDSWQIHDYAVYQAEAMTERVERKREWERDRKAVQRAGKKGDPNARVIADLNHLSHRDTTGTTPGLSQGLVPPNVPRLSHPVPVVSRGTDPIRSDPRRPPNALASPRAHATPTDLGAGTRKAPPEAMAQEGPNEGAETASCCVARPASSKAPEGPASGHDATPPPGHVAAPEIIAPTPAKATATAETLPHSAAASPDPMFVAEGAEMLAAHLAEHWADAKGAKTVTSPGQFGEYVAEKWRAHADGGFQSGASSTLLVGLGRTLVDLRVTATEARVIASMLKHPKDHFGWSKDIQGGQPVTTSFLLGRALHDGKYEARQLSELVNAARAKISKRSLRAVPPPAADRPATVTARPATAEEIREIGRPLMDRLRADKARRDAEEAERSAAAAEARRRADEYWTEEARRAAEVG